MVNIDRNCKFKLTAITNKMNYDTRPDGKLNIQPPMPMISTKNLLENEKI